MTFGELLSIGKAMRLYLCIPQVGLEGNPRRKFLCDDVMNEIHMLTLHNVDLI